MSAASVQRPRIRQHSRDPALVCGVREISYAHTCFSNLASVLLQLKALGVDNVLRFPFVSPPPAQSMARALEFLFALGALDDHCKLTEPLGVFDHGVM